jgi:hypothetical protein
VTIGGWIFLGTSWLLILGLAVFCLVRTFRAKDDGPAS